MQLSDFVCLVPDCLTGDDCDKIVNWYNDNIQDENISRTLSGVNENIRNSSTMTVPYGHEVDLLLSKSINNCFLNYLHYLNSNIQCKDEISFSLFFPKSLQSEQFLINKYEENEFYDWHTDQGDDKLISGRAFDRRFSVVVYLNDDFDGGETEFLFGSITPQKGACLMFPSNFMFPHTARPVKNGVKYSCAVWMSPNPTSA